MGLRLEGQSGDCVELHTKTTRERGGGGGEEATGRGYR